MITPFGPPNDELDRLNTALDAQVTGKRAPKTGPASDTDLLAATAHCIALQPAAPGETPSTDTLDAIWRKVMHAHAIHESTTITGSHQMKVWPTNSAGPVRAHQSQAVPRKLAIAIVAALVLGIIGGAWAMKTGSGENDPIRLAAVVPQGTPSGESKWSMWIQPEECTLERTSPSEVTALQAEMHVVPVPTYGRASVPSPADAEAAANGARALSSCFMFRSDGTYSSKPYLWLYTSPNSPLVSQDAMSEHQESNGRDVSRDMQGIKPSDLLLMTSIQPTDAQQELPITFLPNQAVEFPDGRIGLPMAYLIPESLPLEAPEALYTVLFVLSDKSGKWLLDDSLLVCVGDCDEYLDGGAWQGNEFVPAGEIHLSAPSDATPIATPED